MNQTQPKTAPLRPLPLSGIALAIAYAAGTLGLATFGWILFAVGAMIWMTTDGKTVIKLLTHRTPHHTQRMITYSTPPAIALLAYLTLSEGNVDLIVSGALAFHAILVWAVLMGAAYAVSQESPLSGRI